MINLCTPDCICRFGVTLRTVAFAFARLAWVPHAAVATAQSRAITNQNDNVAVKLSSGPSAGGAARTMVRHAPDQPVAIWAGRYTHEP